MTGISGENVIRKSFRKFYSSLYTPNRSLRVASCSSTLTEYYNLHFQLILIYNRDCRIIRRRITNFISKMLYSVRVFGIKCALSAAGRLLNQILYHSIKVLPLYTEFYEANAMSRVCQVTGKRPVTGNNVSHAKNRTRRRFLPNLHTHRFWVESENRFVKLRVSAKGMRIIDKKGIDEVLNSIRRSGAKV